MENNKKNFRIFLCYRHYPAGENIGETTAGLFYRYLQKAPDWEKRYGKIYYSQETEPNGNVLKDIPRICTVDHFILFLTPGFFDDFKNMKKPISFEEIRYALNLDEDNRPHFTCIQFSGFVFDARVRKILTDCFGEKAVYISAAKLMKFDEKSRELFFQELADLVQKHVPTMREMLCRWEPNVLLGRREKMDKNNFPFFKRLYHCKRITLLNFAATAFFAATSISTQYEDELRDQFRDELLKGNIEATVIITNPHSSAAEDAAACKMQPIGQMRDKKDRIIQKNLNELIKFKRAHPDVQLTIRLTDISLPYGIMLVERESPYDTYMKIDLYGPYLPSDFDRPSFYVLESDKNTAEIYRIFSDNVFEIKNRYSIEVDVARNIPHALMTRSIIHRAKLSDDYKPHTASALFACIRKHYPIEIDLLILEDNTVLVWRDEEVQNYLQEFGRRMLSACDKADVERIRKYAVDNKENDSNGIAEMLTLDELLRIVNGQIAMLIELKTMKHPEEPNKLKKMAGAVYDVLRKYNGEYAIHSADPYVLQEYRKLDENVACGIITTDFDHLNVEDGFKIMHQAYSFDEIFSPDFISCDIRLLSGLQDDCIDEAKRQSAERLLQYVREKDISLFGWTVKSSADVEIADKYCNNMIIEPFKDKKERKRKAPFQP